MNILVLLSTYNGDRYLKEQLDSLLAQRGVVLTILIRDDGSTDSTPTIIDHYCQLHSNIEAIKGENIGCARSFFSLMSHASKRPTRFDYYAFCDQDDLWLDDKLLSAAKILDLYRDNPHRLYYSVATFVDANLQTLHISKIDPTKVNFATSLTRNPALGCTMLFSFRLLCAASQIEQYIDSDRFNPTLLPLHDSWLIKVAFATNSYIECDQTPHILYRQHDNNVTGSKSIFERYSNALKRRIAKRGQFSHTATLLYSLYATQLTKENHTTLNKLLNYKNSLLNTLIFSLRLNLQGELLLDRLIWRLYILNRLY
ncbi:MAG: glycosyltransferase [Rikenellaceae bacterium]